ncbi:GntR family transcriptional regulator [Pseudarthrobacter sp. lyk4-40-TYG-27]|uniref:GntR family transcriptional regulator n=1 Tax=Pseudarthrobacter sp. lyk4-40-TYG-27 TaxID=3040305 RepID=UPI00255519F6|nr:GntR family transcriptional regulator [Pseudarthrobacter sp. lyk4-40-TYG-27]
MSGMQRISPAVSLTGQVTSMIRAAIVSGEMKPNEHYSSVGIAEKLGVSRTPVREALQLLEKEGILTVEKNRGVRVTQISLNDIVEVFQIRLILEPPAAGRAVLNATPADIERLEELYVDLVKAAEGGQARPTLEADKAFHLYFLGLADNAKLGSIVGELRNLVLTHGQITIPHARTSMDLADDRNELMEAIRKHNAEGAVRAMHGHVLRTARMLVQSVCARTPGLEAECYLGRLNHLQI